MKTCTSCGQNKPLDAFGFVGFKYANRERYRRNVCRACYNAEQNAAKARRRQRRMRAAATTR